MKNKRLFPKTRSSSKDQVYGQYCSNTNSILINLEEIKKDFPKTWRRVSIETWLHEFSHVVYQKIHPYSLKLKTIDILSLFKDELVAHAVSWVVESLLFLDHQFDSIDEGATASITSIVHDIKQKYRI